MRIVSLSILFHLIAVTGFGQMWTPTGATWYYDYNDGSTTGYYKISYVGDTLINSTNCQKLEKKLVYYDVFGMDTDTIITYDYVYSDADKLYLFRFNAFSVLYDFTVSVGDTILVPGTNQYSGCDSTGYVMVDTVGTMTINSQSLRFYSVHNLSGSNWGWNCRIVEKIGAIYNFGSPSLSYLLPIKNDFCGMMLDEPKEGGLFRCYSDDFFVTYSITPYSCDVIMDVDKTELSSANLNVYPNPNNGFFMIDFNTINEVSFIQVFDSFGKIVYTQNIDVKTTQISLPKMNSGVYLIQAQGNNTRYIKRFIIN